MASGDLSESQQSQRQNLESVGFRQIIRQICETWLVSYSFLDQQQKFPPSSLEHRKGLSPCDSFNTCQMLGNIYCLSASMIFQPKMSAAKETSSSKRFVFFLECDSLLEGGYHRTRKQNSNGTNQTSPSQANDQDPKLPLSSHQPKKVQFYNIHHILLHF